MGDDAVGNDAVEGFTGRFTDQKLLHVVRIGRQYFQALPELREIMEGVGRKTKRQPFSAGVFLGEEKGGDFRPSIALIDLISHASERWVMVDDNSEWLFLCGRDIFGKSVIKANVKDGIAIVRNRAGEVLGYGEIVDRLENSDRVFLRNRLDRGDFLRREMGKKGGKAKRTAKR
ncbi:hypothetical protein JW898_03495 [Candidatus Woesearchaeota archaeon]|nr:hypothetical protein [Candidatus Woesearchaeota archaeon]